MDLMIEAAERQHFPQLRQVELSAFETLRSAGAVSGEPMASTDEELQRYLDDGLLYVAIDDDGDPVGYVGATIVAEENCIHVGEMDVHPAFQGKGIGRRLLLAILNAARLRGLTFATLTTDRIAPFNARFYQTLGFALVEGTERSHRLTTILEEEIAKGLDPSRRCAMRREL